MENLNINISLPVQAVQIVLRALGRQPYDDVNGVIQHIIKTTNDQIDAAKTPPDVPATES